MTPFQLFEPEEETKITQLCESLIYLQLAYRTRHSKPLAPEPILDPETVKLTEAKIEAIACAPTNSLRLQEIIKRLLEFEAKVMQWKQACFEKGDAQAQTK